LVVALAEWHADRTVRKPAKMGVRGSTMRNLGEEYARATAPLHGQANIL
jgi:hypothetical protein